jgi:hypothetical protein
MNPPAGRIRWAINVTAPGGRGPRRRSGSRFERLAHTVELDGGGTVELLDFELAKAA